MSDLGPTVRAMTQTDTGVFGTPGRSLEADGKRKYGTDARRGQFIERAVARALETWLAGRQDAAAFALCHDLGGFNGVSGHGYGSMKAGDLNIDHLVITGDHFAIIDAKGTGPGVLTVDARGRGILVRADGTVKPQPWLDKRRVYAAMGVVYRLTGLQGLAVWAVPTATVVDEAAIVRARCFQRQGGIITTIGEIYDGALDEDFPAPQPPASAAVVRALVPYLSDPADRGITAAEDARTANG